MNRQNLNARDTTVTVQKMTTAGNIGSRDMIPLKARMEKTEEIEDDTDAGDMILLIAKKVPKKENEKAKRMNVN